MGYPLAELAARAWARTKTDRTLHARFVFRDLGGRWAAKQACLTRADTVIAPSCAARALFAAAPQAKKILLLDMPGLRALHDDLDLAAAHNARSVYLNRYRAPDWVLVNQEVEWQLADEIHVRGRFVQDLLIARGIPEDKIQFVPQRIEQPVARKEGRAGSQVRVLLAGLASARHGTHELLSALHERPWLEIYARSGEGCEPAEFVQHPRVHRATKESLAEVDAVVVPSFCETYLPELRQAKASGIPVIATLRGAAHLSANQLFAELSPKLGHSLPRALDKLRTTALKRR
jgi:glycosyltransferase involved in cell wall biosynthesis